jgi:hypothetical protein
MQPFSLLLLGLLATITTASVVPIAGRDLQPARAIEARQGDTDTCGRRSVRRQGDTDTGGYCKREAEDEVSGVP